MIITLTVIGIFFIIIGTYLLINEKKPTFVEFLENAEKRDDRNNILKKINDMDDKINYLIGIVENIQRKEEIAFSEDEVHNKNKEELDTSNNNIKEEQIKENDVTVKGEASTLDNNNQGNNKKLEVMKKINLMKSQNKSIDEIASALNLGKGEVLFLENLSKKY